MCTTVVFEYTPPQALSVPQGGSVRWIIGSKQTNVMQGPHLDLNHSHNLDVMIDHFFYGE